MLRPIISALARSSTRALVASLAVCLALLALAPRARADDPPAPVPARLPAPATATATAPHVTVELVAETTTVKPGTTVTLGIVFRLEPHWHVYWRNPGDSGEAPTVRWTLPTGAAAGPILWPAPRRLVVATLAAFAYEEEVLLPVEVALPATLGAGTATFTADVEWLVCREECVPGHATLSITRPVADAEPAADPVRRDLFASTRAILPEALPASGVRATRESSSFALRLTGVGPWTDPRAHLEFFPEGDVLVNTATQRVVRGDGATALLLPRALARSGGTPTLAGVLTVTVGGARAAYAVEAAVGPAEGDAWLLPTETSDLSLGLALLLAFLGGVVLNLMPCVLPVLSLKVLGFVERAGESPALVRRHGFVYGAGVLASFGALAAILLALRAGGERVGWGFQLQDPRFVAILCLVMAGLGASLLGAIDLGASFARLGGGGIDKGYTASFLGGALATVVATPCTGPFMGPALGFALTRPSVEAVAILLSLGVGMAAPYVLLASFPGWLRWVPKSGPWMDTMKRATAFPLVATAIWLAWVLGQQNGVNGMATVLGAALLVSIGLWLLGHYGAPHRSTAVRWIAGRGVGLAVVALAVVVGLRAARPPPPPLAWERWSSERVAEATSEGKVVLVDFTADWCLTCQVNDQTVLATDEVRDAVARHRVVLLKADWTKRDARITEALASFGRASVPLYVVYAPGGREPVVLPTNPLLTVETVTSALDAATSGKTSPAPPEPSR